MDGAEDLQAPPAPGELLVWVISESERIISYLGQGHWKVFHAPGSVPKLMHIWTTLTAFSRLQK